MVKIAVFTPDQLSALIAEGSAGFASRGQWINKMRASFAGVVNRRPLAYRSFGPYWWPLKRLLIEGGELQAELPAPDLEAEVSLGDAALNIAAAFAYQDAATDNLTAMNTTHTVDTEDGDTRDYVVIDDEMEGRAALAASLS